MESLNEYAKPCCQSPYLCFVRRLLFLMLVAMSFIKKMLFLFLNIRMLQIFYDNPQTVLHCPREKKEKQDGVYARRNKVGGDQCVAIVIHYSSERETVFCDLELPTRKNIFRFSFFLFLSFLSWRDGVWREMITEEGFLRKYEVTISGENINGFQNQKHSRVKKAARP